MPPSSLSLSSLLPPFPFSRYRVLCFDIDASVSIQGGDEPREIIPSVRISQEDGWQTDKFKDDDPEAPFTVVIHFDNAFSWARSKDVEYRFNIVDDVDAAVG